MASHNSVHIFITLVIVSGVSSIRITTEGHVDVPGDVKIIGLFKVNEFVNGKCNGDVDITSVMTVEAVKWYIQQLNEKGELPLKIGFEAIETCGIRENAAKKAIQIMNRAMSGERIVGVIGPEFSTEVEAIAPILSAFNDQNKMSLVGFSTTAARLTDRNRFPNFVRVIPNDDIQVELMIKSMVKLEWSRVAIVYEDNIYGQDMEYSLQVSAKEVGICVALSRKISVSYNVNLAEVYNISRAILYGTDQITPLNGIVFIGSRYSAKYFIEYMTNERVAPLPIVMFSEGSNLDIGIFTKSGGGILAKALGSLLLSPEYTEIQDFSLYWKTIFSNFSVFEAENSSNPWLTDVYYNLKECAAKDCIFTNVSNDVLDKTFAKQPLYIKYAILAAHALIKGAALLHNRQCSTTQGMCSELQNNFRPGDVVHLIRGMEINLEKDFPWSPKSLRSQATLTISNLTGDSTFLSEDTSYQLFNFQKNPDIVFQTVGALINKDANISFGSIRDYDIQGRELMWPNVRKGQCLEQRKCTECIPLDELQEAFLFEPGDIYVVGVASVFQKLGVQSCGEISVTNGYTVAEAIRFQVLQANKKTENFANAFPGIKIGVIVLNSCMSPSVIQRKLLYLNKFGIRLANGTLIKLNNKIIGYVAEYTSTVSIAVADVLTPLKYVQISYASTSPALSDRSKYPYFMRVVTPDDKQSKAMVDIMMRLGVQYIQIIYSTGAYGEDGKNKVQSLALANSICTAQDVPIDEDENMYSIYDMLKKYPHARVVVVFLYPNVLLKFTAALTRQMKQRGEFIFIGSEGWARMGEVLDADINRVLLGSVTLSLEMYRDNELKHFIRNNVNSVPFSVNPWSGLYVQEKYNCFTDTSFDKTKPRKCPTTDDIRTDSNYTLDTYDTPALIATISLLIGANSHFQKKCGNNFKDLCADFVNDALGLVEEIKKVKLDLDGINNKMNVFDNNGDGNIGYRIYNIQKDPDNPQSVIYSEVGRYPLSGTFTFEINKIVYPTTDKFTSGCPNVEVCSKCLAQGSTPATTETKKIGRDDGTIVLALGVSLALVGLVTVILGTKLFWIFLKQKRADKDVYLRPISDPIDVPFTFPRKDDSDSVIPPCSQEIYENRYVVHDQKL